MNDEPYALSANESPIFELPDGRRLTIATSPVFSPMFIRYCSMMRRTDLLKDPRFATATLRKANLSSLMAEVKAWILTFTDLDQLQAQVSEAGLAIGVVRSTQDLADSEWAKDWGAVVEVDDRDGGTVRMPGPAMALRPLRAARPGLALLPGREQRRSARRAGDRGRADRDAAQAGRAAQPPQPGGAFD